MSATTGKVRHEAAMISLIRNLAAPLAPRKTGMKPNRSPLPGVQAVLFDVYGTLLISASGDVGTEQRGKNAAALAEALHDAGLEGHIEAAAEKGSQSFHAAIEAVHAERKAAGSAHPEVNVRELWTQVLDGLAASGWLRRPPRAEEADAVALGYEMRVNPVWPMPGARNTLRALAQRGLPLGIVSNAQWYTPLLFPALFGASLPELGFDPSLCAWSWKTGSAKPSPSLFSPVRAALRAKGIAPASTVFVGNDLLNDIAFAKTAGCRAVLFAGDRRSLRLREGDPRCADFAPDRISTRLHDLPTLIAG